MVSKLFVKIQWGACTVLRLESNGRQLVRDPLSVNPALTYLCSVFVDIVNVEYTGWCEIKWTTMQSVYIIYVGCCSTTVSFSSNIDVRDRIQTQ